MPDPTKAQFLAARKKVMETAPPGLSKEEFFALIDKELQASPSTVKPVDDSEPGDYWGGFRKSVGESLHPYGLWDTTKRFISRVPGGMKDAIDPKSLLQGMRAWSKDDAKRKMGVFPEDEHDMLYKPNPLGTPEGIGHATGGAMVGAAIVPSAISTARTLPYRSIARGGLKVGAATLDNPAANLVSHRLPIVGKGMDKLADKIGTTPKPTPFSGLPLAVQQDQLPATPAPERARFPGPPATGHEDVPFNELPIYKQMEHTAQTPEATVPLAGGRTQIPPVQPSPKSPEPPPRLVKAGSPESSPATLEEALAQALAEEQPLDSRVSSLPPEPTMTGEGPTKQSGKFGKSEQVGQPGGYSSGRPSLTPDQYDDLMRKMGGTGEADLPLRESAPAEGGNLEDVVRRLIEEDVVPEKPGSFAPEAFRSTENPEWHGGHEPGSMEAHHDQLSHQYEGELDNAYRSATEEERAYFADKARLERMKNHDYGFRPASEQLGEGPRPSTPGTLQSGPDLVTLIKKLFRR